jgi:TRAP-type transport system small permease protein
MQMLLSGYVKMVELINKGVGWIISIFLAIMSILIFWQVIARYIIGSSLAWSEELSRFLMIWIVLLGAALALKKGRMIVVEIFSESKYKLIVNNVSNLVSLFFYIVLLIYGWQLALTISVQTAPGLNISMFWAYLSLPIGGLLMIINTISVIIEESLPKGG